MAWTRQLLGLLLKMHISQMCTCLSCCVCALGGFYGAIWKYALVILVAAPLFAATDFVEMRLVLEWRRWLTSTLMSGYFANRTFFKLHHQLGLLDNPDQVRHNLPSDCCSFCERHVNKCDKYLFMCRGCATTCRRSQMPVSRSSLA